MKFHTEDPQIWDAMASRRPVFLYRWSRIILGEAYVIIYPDNVHQMTLWTTWQTDQLRHQLNKHFFYMVKGPAADATDVPQP